MINAVTVSNPAHRRSAWERLCRAVITTMCIRWLQVQGFRVLRIEQDHALPRIFIGAGPLCEALLGEGATSHFERGIGFQRRYKQVMLADCEVRWNEGEA